MVSSSARVIAHPQSFTREIVGASSALHDVLERIRLAAEVDVPVLLLGETGTGKELLARTVHDQGTRAARPFIAVNCGALPDTLAQSELLGHERGAFTGADGSRAGLFEQASGGTVFLDEIGDMAFASQATLLRLLEEHEVRRLGATRLVRLDFNVVAATNQDIYQRAAAGTFRADLLFRLNVFPVRVPPLRERPEDIEPLASYFLRLFSVRQARTSRRLGADAMRMLIAQRWPGNVRQLRNVLERSAILATSGDIGVETVAEALGGESWPGGQEGPAERERTANNVTCGTAGTFADAARRTILQALEETGWRISGKGGAAEVLELKPTTLHAKMKHLGIKRPTRQQPFTGVGNPASVPVR